MPDLFFASKGAADVIRQQTLINERAAELSSIYKDDARAARELEAAATRIFKNAANPIKAFNEEMGKLFGNLRQGKINAAQYEKGIEKLTDAYEQANTISGKLKAQLSSMFGSGQIKQLATFAAGVLSVQKAVQLATNEYQSAIELIDKGARTQLDTSSSRKAVIRNLVGSSDAELRKVLTSTQQLAAELRLPETVINKTFVDALSASGNNVPIAMEATRLAGRFLPDAPEDMSEFAGSTIDMGAVTGTTDPRVNFGLLAQISQLSRVASPRQIAMNAPQALVGMHTYGATGQEAASLYSALTVGAKDKMGAESGTGSIALAAQLATFGGADAFAKKKAEAQKNLTSAEARLAEAQQRLAEQKSQTAENIADQIADAKKALARAIEDKKYALTKQSKIANKRRIDDAQARVTELTAKQAGTDPGTLSAQRSIASQQANVAKLREAAGASEDPRLAQFRGLATMGQRIAFLQQNPDLADAFLKGASFEKKVGGPVRDLFLTPGSETARTYAADLKAIPGNDALATLGDATINQFRLDPIEPLAVTSRSLVSLRDRLMLSGPQNLGGDERKALEDILKKLGGTNLGTQMKTFMGQLSDRELGISVPETRDILEQERLRLSTPRTISSPQGGNAGLSGDIVVPPTEGDKKNAALLNAMINILNDQLKAQQETNRKLDAGGLVGGGS